MKVLACPASFKGTLSSSEAAAAMARGWRTARPGDSVAEVPLADGGEGTVEAILAATEGERRSARVHDPLHRTVEAAWGRLPDGTAILEMAVASGLLLVAESERDPEATSTFGTGELIRAALDAGCRTLRIGIGGSATTDGGAGAAQALGARFFDSKGSELPAPIRGGDLAQIARVDLDRLDARLAQTQLFVACDVDNPLTGSHGAAAVYGPQKGASPQAVARLDAGLAALARATRPELADLPGAGAAGGLGFGLMAFCRGELVPGSAMVLDAVRFAERLKGCSCVLTGEGKVDGQTLRGKVAAAVLELCRAAGVPVLLIAGASEVEREELRELGVHNLFLLSDLAPTSEEAMDEAARWVEEAARHAAVSMER